jgi:uncharacterized protein (TIGR02147 family)
MSPFQHSNYRTYLKDRLSNMPKAGRGEIGRMAVALNVHSTLISLVMSGERDLNQEQAFDLCAYLELTEAETEYFCLLVQRERAGNKRYESHLLNKLKKLRTESQKIQNRFEHDKKITEEERSTFYSHWIYSAVRLYCSTHESGRNLDQIIERFQIPRPRALEILSFLQSAGLVSESGGRYTMHVKRTFLEQGSPHLPRHHTNWRLRALTYADSLTDKELMFTSPMSLSRQDFGKLREMIAELLKNTSEVVKDSPAEDVACLNVDLFWVKN